MDCSTNTNIYVSIIVAYLSILLYCKSNKIIYKKTKLILGKNFRNNIRRKPIANLTGWKSTLGINFSLYNRLYIIKLNNIFVFITIFNCFLFDSIKNNTYL